MSDSRDYLALDWVKDEIRETLNQAQHALEAYVENPDDATRIRFCVTYLHQIYGTLHMVEFYGAALMAEEMENLSVALSENTAPDPEAAGEVLMASILLLPRYLDRVKAGRYDHPLLVLPYLNDLRAARGESLLSETALFKPDLAFGRLDSIKGTVKDIPDIQVLLRKIRQLYQFALVGVLRNEDFVTNIAYLAKALGRLERLYEGAPLVQLWRAGLGLVAGVSDSSIELSLSVKTLLSLIDKKIKEVVEVDSPELADSPVLSEDAPEALLKNLLYYVAKSNSEADIVRQLQAAYKLDQALPGDIDVSTEALLGPDHGAMTSVVTAIHEEIAECKLVLDGYERSVHGNLSTTEGMGIDGLAPLVPSFKKIADTLTLLGIGLPRHILYEQIDVVNRIIAEEQVLSDETIGEELLAVADALLYLEATLSRTVSHSAHYLPLERVEDAVTNNQASVEELQIARVAVMRECLSDLESAKEGIVGYIASQWDGSNLEQVPQLLLNVRGGLIALNLHRSANVLLQCVAYVREQLIQAKQNPQFEALDSLADGITSVEYFLECLYEGDDQNDNLLVIAEQAIAELGYPHTQLADPEALAADIDPRSDLIDEDDVPILTASLDAGIDISIASDDDSSDFDEISFESDLVALENIDAENRLDDGEGELVSEFYDLESEPLDGKEAGSLELEANADNQDSEYEFFEEEVSPVAGDDSALADEVADDSKQDVLEAASFDLEEDEEEVDEELVEIFVEEAEEVLETLNEYFPQWREAPEESEPMAEIRRAFHTLKGSGRMVSAGPVAELAWSMENLLNKVIESLVPCSPAVFSLIEQGLLVIPTLVANFRDHVPPQIDITPYENIANRLLDGEEVDDVSALLSSAGNDSTADAAVAVSHAVALEQVPLLDITQVRPSVDAAAAELKGDEDQVLDPILIDIFRKETFAHLAVVERFLELGESSPGPFTPQLLRALHTLKGSSHTAEVQPIVDVVRPLEGLIKRLASDGQNLDKDLFDVLDVGTDLIQAGIAQLEVDPLAPLEGIDEYVATIERLESRYLSSPTPFSGDAEEESDDQLITDFLASGMDLIADSSDALVEWQSDLSQQDNLSIIRAKLQVLSDSAAAANLTFVQQLSNALEETYKAVQDGLLQPDESFFEVVHEGHESLMSMLDQLVSNQVLHPAMEIIMALQGCRESSLEDAPIPVPSSDVSSDSTIQQVFDAPAETMASAAETNIFHEPVSEASDDWETDPELIEIFLEEAMDIVENSSTALGLWAKAPSDIAQVEELQRDLHTLKGGARLAGIRDIGDLAHELEAAYEMVCAQSVDYSAPLETLLHKCHDELAAMVEAVQAGNKTVAAMALINELHAFLQAADTSTTDTPLELGYADTSSPVEQLVSDQRIVLSDAAGDASEDHQTSSRPAVLIEPIDADVDSDIFDIFIEEADDIVAALDQTIQDWLDSPTDKETIEEMQRLLHTLKGSARLAGLKQLGDIAHYFEDFLEKNSDAQVDREIVDEVHKHHDEIIQVLEAVKQIRYGTPIAEAGSSDSITEDDRSAIVPPETEVLQQLQAIVGAKGGGSAGSERGDIDLAAVGRRAVQQEMVRVSASLLENLVNLAGETSISRGRVEQEVSDFSHIIDEMAMTINRVREQLRRLDSETEAMILHGHEQTGVNNALDEEFDPLELDRYSTLNQLSRSLVESVSDLQDIKDTLVDRTRDTETLLVQQGRINTELQEGLMRTRMEPFSRLTPRLRRLTRQVASQLRKEVEFEVLNAEGELDKSVLDRMVAPLEHMLRNAVDHGIEMPEERKAKGKPSEGRITLHLVREGGEVVLRLIDDGAGLDVESIKAKAIRQELIPENTVLTDKEIMQFIFRSGFSTAKEVTQISGRGVGLDVVHREIKQLGGSLRINSALGSGSQFTIRLPFTVAVNRALMVRVGEESSAIPLNNIEGIVRVSPLELESYYQDDAPAFKYAGQSYTLRYLGSYIQGTPRPNLKNVTQPLPVLLVRGGDQPIALQVDMVIGAREVVVKAVGPQLSSVAGISGATILGDGSVVIILDLLALIRAEHATNREQKALATAQSSASNQANVKQAITVMVVDDSVTVRKVTTRLLERNGMEVLVAKDGVHAVSQLRDRIPDIMLLDIEMPRMDGFEVATLVRHDERLMNIPIIMITSRTGDKHRERAYSIGVNQYMGKPFQEAELMESIEQLLSQKAQA